MRGAAGMKHRVVARPLKNCLGSTATATVGKAGPIEVRTVRRAKEDTVC